MKKYYLIFGIIVLIIITVIVMVNFQSQPKTTGGGDYATPAEQVFNSGAVVASEQDAKNLIISNSNKVIEGTLNLYNRYPDLINNSRYSLFKKILDLVGKNWQFNDTGLKAEKGFCAGLFCVGYDYESSGKYVVTVLSPNAGTREKIICNDPLEQPATNERTGKTSSCSGGIKEKRIVNLNSKLMYIVDKDGKVYFAGAYPTQE